MQKGTLPRLLSGRTRMATRTLEVAPNNTGSLFECVELAEGVEGLDAIILTSTESYSRFPVLVLNCSWNQQPQIGYLFTYFKTDHDW